MKVTYPSKEIERENQRIMEIWVNSDEEDIDVIINKYASQEFKDYIKNRRNEEKQLEQLGIMT